MTDKSVPIIRATLHILALPAVLILGPIFWAGAPLWAALFVAVVAMASTYWGVWLIIRRIEL